MFEKETESIIKTAQERTIGNQPAVSVKDILAADIPYSLKIFLRARVETILQEELHYYMERSRFNYNNSEIRSLQKQINSILVLNYSFERSEYLGMLEDTVHLLVNYFIRPQWALTSVIFEKEKSLSSSKLLNVLHHFGAYEYLRGIMAQYIHDKNIPSLTREEFSSLLWKIDSEYTRRKTGDEIARIMEQLFDFLEYPEKSGNKAIPAKGLIKYFEDKGMTTVQNRLENEIMKGVNEFTKNDLGVLLEDIRKSTGAFHFAKTENTEGIEDSNHSGNFSLSTGENMKTSADAAVRPPDRNQILSLEESEGRRILKKIFKQNEADFQTFLRYISGISTWKEASKFIDETFISNDVDPLSSEAKRLIEIVFQKYYPKK